MKKSAKEKLADFRAKHEAVIRAYSDISRELYQLEDEFKREIGEQCEGKMYKGILGGTFLIIKSYTFKFYAIVITDEKICLTEFPHDKLGGKEEIQLNEIEPILKKLERRIAMVRALDINGLKEESNL